MKTSFLHLSLPVFFTLSMNAGAQEKPSLVYHKQGSDLIVTYCTGKVGAATDRHARCEGPQARVPFNAFADRIRENLDEQAHFKAKYQDWVAKNREHMKETPLNADEAFKLRTRELAEIVQRAGAANTDRHLTRKPYLPHDPKKFLEAEEFDDFRDKDAWIFEALLKFQPNKLECGTDEIIRAIPTSPAVPGGAPDKTKGNKISWLKLGLEKVIASAHAQDNVISIEDRVQNCSKVLGQEADFVSSSAGNAGKHHWKMVTRRRDPTDGDYHEVWRDEETGLIWGSKLDGSYTHANAVALNVNGTVAQQKACINQDARNANAFLSGVSFRLPTLKDAVTAREHGMEQVVSGLNTGFFWTTDLEKGSSAHKLITGAHIFSGVINDDKTTFSTDGELSVICVADSPK